MRTPAAALLWECWRLSRRSLAIVMLCATLGGAALLIGFSGHDWSATLVLTLAVVTGLSARVWADNVNSRSGFTMTLGFVRPIRTALLVGVPMAYVAVSTALAYLLPMVLLRATLGTPFPLVPVAALVSSVSVAFLASQWWTGNERLRLGGRFALAFPAMAWFASNPFDGGFLPAHRWEDIFAFTTPHYLAMALVVAASAGITGFGVTRQRFGEDLGNFLRQRARSASPRAVSTWRSRIEDALRMECPTSSAVRAQLWFETRTTGMRVLSSGTQAALAVALVGGLAAVTGVVPAETFVLMAMLGATAPFITACRSVLGLRRRQGVAYLSAFDRIRPLGTAPLIGLKVAIDSLALLLSWLMIAAAVWLGALWLTAAGRPGTEVVREIMVTPSVFTCAVAAVLIAAALSYVAAVRTLFLLRPAGVIATALCGGLYLVGLIYAAASGRIGEGVVNAHFLLLTGTGLLAALFLFRTALRERIVTAPYIAFAVPAAAIASICLLFVLNPPTQVGGRLEFDTDALLALTVPGLLATVLAPWSLGRLRHG